MKFEFKKEASKVLDYILFPGIYYFLDEQKNFEDDLIKIISEEYREFVEKSHSLLNDYKEDIKKYYNDDIYSSYDFTNILVHGFPVYDYKNEHEYLKSLTDIDDLEFRKKIIKTLMTLDEDDKPTKDEDQEVFTESKALEYINELKIDSSNKWNLLMMIQNPKTYLKGFIGLLEKVQSIFYNYYEKHEKDVEALGFDLVNRLSKDTEKTFKEITHDSISYDFTGSDICYLYVSAVYPHSLRFITTNQSRIIWGMRMEESFNKLYEIREDKLTQRVKIFKALGDKTRYETLKLLASGISSIKDIAQTLDVSSATISYHVNEFLTSGILNLKLEKNKKSGYKVDYNKLKEVIDEFIADLNFPE
ncbi:MAG: hypothetical protein ACLFPM_04240 [Candidatus Izemoplasmatales bacterium]